MYCHLVPQWTEKLKHYYVAWLPSDLARTANSIFLRKQRGSLLLNLLGIKIIFPFCRSKQMICFNVLQIDEQTVVSAFKTDKQSLVSTFETDEYLFQLSKRMTNRSFRRLKRISHPFRTSKQAIAHPFRRSKRLSNRSFFGARMKTERW